MNLRLLSSADLLSKTRIAIKEERLSTLRVLHLFREIERRRAFGGFTSLFEMATKEFGYSASAAQRRIHAMRLLRNLPEYEKKIESGELSLTAAASAQSYFLRSKSLKKDKVELLENCLNKSSREVQKEIARLEPEADKRADMRFSSNERVRMSVNISVEMYERLEKLKFSARCSSIEEVIDLLMMRKPSEAEIVKLDKSQIGVATQQKNAENAIEKSTVGEVSLPAPVVRARHIPAVTKKIVIKKSEPKCSYVDPITKVQCCESMNLELDHIYPFSKGGPHLPENLRLMCAPHNKHVWNSEQKNL